MVSHTECWMACLVDVLVAMTIRGRKGPTWGLWTRFPLLQFLSFLKLIKLCRSNKLKIHSIASAFEHRLLLLLFFSPLSFLHHLQHLTFGNVLREAPFFNLPFELFLPSHGQLYDLGEFFNFFLHYSPNIESMLIAHNISYLSCRVVLVEKKLPDKSLLRFPLLRRDSFVWPASWRRH